MVEDVPIEREVAALLATVGLPSRQRVALSNTEEAYPGPFRVTLAATASVAAATAAVARLVAGGAEPPAVAVDGRLRQWRSAASVICAHPPSLTPLSGIG